MSEQDLQFQIDALKKEIAGLRQEPPFVDHQHNGYDSTKISIADIDQKVYGHMYCNTHTAITVSSTSSWYEMTSNFSINVIKGALFAGGHYIKIALNGTYHVELSAALEVTAGNHEIATTIMVNGVATELMHSHASSVANQPVGTAGSGIFNFSKNDQISLAVKNHTSATNITVAHAQVVLVRIA